MNNILLLVIFITCCKLVNSAPFGNGLKPDGIEEDWGPYLATMKRKDAVKLLKTMGAYEAYKHLLPNDTSSEGSSFVLQPKIPQIKLDMNQFYEEQNRYQEKKDEERRVKQWVSGIVLLVVVLPVIWFKWCKYCKNKRRQPTVRSIGSQTATTGL